MIVWIPDHKCSGRVVSQVGPHSYKVLVPSGTLRRNRRHLIVSPNEQFTIDEDLDLDFMPHLSEDINDHAPRLPEPPTRSGTVFTRSGRDSRPPQCYSPDDN